MLLTWEKLSRLAAGRVESPHAPINLQKALCLTETLFNVVCQTNASTELSPSPASRFHVYAHELCNWLIFGFGFSYLSGAPHLVASFLVHAKGNFLVCVLQSPMTEQHSHSVARAILRTSECIREVRDPLSHPKMAPSMSVMGSD